MKITDLINGEGLGSVLPRSHRHTMQKLQTGSLQIALLKKQLAILTKGLIGLIMQGQQRQRQRKESINNGFSIANKLGNETNSYICTGDKRLYCFNLLVFKLVESKQSSALSYHTIYRFHRTPPSGCLSHAQAIMFIAYVRRIALT